MQFCFLWISWFLFHLFIVQVCSSSVAAQFVFRSDSSTMSEQHYCAFFQACCHFVVFAKRRAFLVLSGSHWLHLIFLQVLDDLLTFQLLDAAAQSSVTAMTVASEVSMAAATEAFLILGLGRIFTVAEEQEFCFCFCCFALFFTEQLVPLHVPLQADFGWRSQVHCDGETFHPRSLQRSPLLSLCWLRPLHSLNTESSAYIFLSNQSPVEKQQLLCLSRFVKIWLPSY